MSRDYLEDLISILDNRAEFESFAESEELASLESFELVPVEFIPYDEEGTTITERKAN